MANDVRADEIHPELRRVARFAPRQIVYPWSLPILRRLSIASRSSNDGVDVMDLPGGAGARLYRPTAAGRPPRRCCGSTAAVTCSAARSRTMRCAGGTCSDSASLSPRCAIALPSTLPDSAGGLLPGADLVGRAAGRGCRPDRDRWRECRRGLTAALSFLARDRGEVSPALQVLSYPMLDDRTVGPRPREARLPIVERPQQPVRLDVLSRRGRSGGGGAGPPAPISSAWRRPGSGWAPWTCSAQKTWPTPPDSTPPAWSVRCTRCLGHSMDSTDWHPKPLSHRPTSTASARASAAP